MAQLVECQTRTGVCAVESLKGSSVLHYSALDVYMYAFTFVSSHAHMYMYMYM